MTETRVFLRACALSDLPVEGVIGVEVAGEPVAIARAEGEVYAIRDVCSHAEVPLSEGEIYDHTVECWLHGSCFDLRTGEPTGLPATEPVPVYPVKIEGDDVYVAMNKELLWPPSRSATCTSASRRVQASSGRSCAAWT
jgi:3-phenylpropionate/trans-cinnamate dioxygenase ferredoxin component